MTVDLSWGLLLPALVPVVAMLLVLVVDALAPRARLAAPVLGALGLGGLPAEHPVGARERAAGHRRGRRVRRRSVRPRSR